MTDPFFFGYGSLVNRSTHDYPAVRIAQLQGWRREWVRTHGRAAVYLSARPDPQSTISGLVAAVPGSDWVALDVREHGYHRHEVTPAVVHDGRIGAVSVYAVPTDRHIGHGDHVILLSYLDVVVQGFLREFGAQGVADFFASTDGWETPVLNDRANPRYSRHRPLNAEETALVDTHLDSFGAVLTD